ncbi:MAG: hypothetical protein FWC57_01975 [Endomicrobia bacterium]|nr:hypothetical protein [Endomicrobiia bacterium]
METKEIIDSLQSYIRQSDALKDKGGPKDSEFIKWVKEVKSFIEKTFGSSYPKLREFKKVDYYPKKLDIFATESAFRKAWIEGLDQAGLILKSILKELGVEDEEEPKEEIQENKADIKVEAAAPAHSGVKAELKEESKKEKEENKENNDDDDDDPNIIEIKTEDTQPVPQQPVPPQPVKAAEPVKPVKPAKASPVKEKEKVLLLDIDDRALSENIYKFLNKMGYEPVLIDQNINGNIYYMDADTDFLSGKVAYVITMWKGLNEYLGKKFPNPESFIAAGFVSAKYSCKNVLILHSKDIDPLYESFTGLNFLETDNVWELMELKIAQKMDDAGMNIDFNFFKKK